MIFRLLLSVTMLLVLPFELPATVRLSGGSGNWNSIAWIPAGLPGPEDTVIVTTHVTGMPPGRYGLLVIEAGASLGTAPGLFQISGLENHGELRPAAGTAVRSVGDVFNGGTLSGTGVLEMTADGSILSGGGDVSNLLINVPWNGTIRLEDSFILGSLYVASGRLMTGEYDLTVDGDFTSASPFGEPGVVAGTGLVTLNGPGNGSVRGNVRFGWVTGEGTPHHPLPPGTHGTYGGLGAMVTFASDRRVSFCEFPGSVVVDPGVILTARGIGGKGVSTVRGDLLNRGLLTASDDLLFWKVEGNLRNEGEIDHCTILMTGHQAELRTNEGAWGYDASLEYRASSGGRLQIYGSMTLPRLTIGTLSPVDSGVTVAAGWSELLVRHRYISDRSRGCGLISDTLVRLRKDADGIIIADINFEGFFNSMISGTFGGVGRVVRMSMPKRIVGETRFTGTFQQTPNARLALASSLLLPPGTTLEADVTVEEGGVLTTGGDLTTLRDLRGGGRVELLGSVSDLDVRGGFLDSLRLCIGRDTVVSHVNFVRSVVLPRMTIHPGSIFSHPDSVDVVVSDDLRYRIEAGPGYGLFAPAVIPADPVPSAFFPGADSDIFVIDENLNYQIADTIRVGRGYWVSFPERIILEQRGEMIERPLTIPVVEGWNVIGGIGTPTATADIVKTGTSELSPYYQYAGGYVSSSSILPGRGYLVQFGGAGEIVVE